MIVVSGASRGIGRALADRLTAQGHEVLGIARHSAGASFPTAEVDVTSEVAVKELARSLRRNDSPVTALVNAAGIGYMNLALMAPASSVRKVIDTNLLGTMFLCQSIAPLLIRSGGGTVINFSTIAVSLALQGESAYVASKAGVEAFSRVLARELAGHDVTVNCVAPGPIATDLLRGVSPEQVETLVQRQIQERQFSVDDVCDIVEILLDPRSRTLTGHVLHVGGV